MQTDDKMQAQIEESIQSFIGSTCEVLTPHNDLLLVGTLHRYNAANTEVFIELNQGAIPPRAKSYKDTVKVQFHRPQNKESVQVFWGIVTGISSRDWRIQLNEAVLVSETRQTFRQRTHCKVDVTRIWTESYKSSPTPCQLVDISLGGLCFRSHFKYLLREHLLVSSVQLREGGTIYDFNSVVRRIQSDRGDSDDILYGCQFLELTPQDENALCQDIFALQSEELTRFKK